MVARSYLLVPFLFAACGTVRDWRELKTEPMPIGDCYEGIAWVASRDGYQSDDSVSDRGFGIWQSRWRNFVLPENRHPGRFRLRVEVLLDEGNATEGWPIRYAIDQEVIDDLRRSRDPREEDWSAAGQYKEREAILGERFLRKLAPKSVAPATRPADSS